MATSCNQTKRNPASADQSKTKREVMVENQIRSKGITDPAVIKAFLKVPRHKFIEKNIDKIAYQDSKLPIGNYQMMASPYITAMITSSAKITSNDKILEIGTGSGYHTAILAEIAKEVYSIEIDEMLAEKAKANLSELAYKNIHLKTGDGSKGWSSKAPFDVIIGTAAPDKIPQELIDQLKIGGRMIIPLGHESQELVKITKTRKGTLKESILPVKFVPLKQVK